MKNEISRRRKNSASAPMAAAAGFAALLSSAVALPAEVHVVARDECLSRIIQKRIAELNLRSHGFSIFGRNGLIDAVLRLNPHILDPDRIRPGTRILFPKQLVSDQQKSMSRPRVPPSNRAALDVQLAMRIDNAPIPAAPAVLESGSSIRVSDERNGTPLYWNVSLALNGERKDIEESANGVLSRTVGQDSFPNVGFEVSFRAEPSPFVPHWEFGFSGAVAKRNSLDGILFPTGSSAAVFLRKSAIDLSDSLYLNVDVSGSYDRIAEATPDMNGMTYLVRSTGVLWASTGSCIGFRTKGERFCVQLSRSLNASSDLPSGAYPMAKLSGWRETVSLASQLALKGRITGELAAHSVQLSSASSSDYLREFGVAAGIKINLDAVD